MTIDDLAVMVQHGFEETMKKSEVMQAGITSLDVKLEEFKKETRDNFTHVHARLGAIENDVKNVVHRDEFEDLMARVKYLEKQAGIKSGK